jgi:hypothetical protein
MIYLFINSFQLINNREIMMNLINSKTNNSFEKWQKTFSKVIYC